MSGNIAGNVSSERVSSAIERFRIFDKGSGARIAKIIQWHVDAFS